MTHIGETYEGEHTDTTLPANVTEIRNPAAVGWEWDEDNGPDFRPTTWQIAWSRGQAHFMFARKMDNGSWSTVGMMDREAWHCDGTLEDARKVVAAFIAKADGVSR